MELVNKIKLKDIGEIRKYPNNPKKHPKDQIDSLVKSIKEFGFTVPIIIKDNEIVTGHGRVEAAKVLGLKKIPVIERDDLTDVQVKAFRIADNRIAESTWFIDKLNEEIAGLKEVKFDLEKLGFNMDEISSFNIDFDNESNDAYKEWETSGTLDYDNEDVNGFKLLIVHFPTEDAVKKFADLIGQNITEKTKSIWFPKADQDVVHDIAYEEDEED